MGERLKRVTNKQRKAARTRTEIIYQRGASMNTETKQPTSVNITMEEWGVVEITTQPTLDVDPNLGFIIRTEDLGWGPVKLLLHGTRGLVFLPTFRDDVGKRWMHFIDPLDNQHHLVDFEMGRIYCGIFPKAIQEPNEQAENAAKDTVVEMSFVANHPLNKEAP